MAMIIPIGAKQYHQNGYRTLWAGDFNGDGKLKFTNPSDDINVLYFDILSMRATPSPMPTITLAMVTTRRDTQNEKDQIRVTPTTTKMLYCIGFCFTN